MADFPIDAVIAWVNGNDPEHKAKRFRYTRKRGREFQHEDIASDVRFDDNGEIKYCLAGLLRYAPWLRTVFIVTDNQIPPIQDVLDKFPDRTTQVKIIDHTDMAKGYEKYLPTFNSLTVESLLWRIPGLSEHYIYLNDDFFLVGPVGPGHFFRNGKTVAYVRPFPRAKVEERRRYNRRRFGHKQADWQFALLRAAEVAGIKGDFNQLDHTPLAQNKSLFEKFYARHRFTFRKNLRYRFRSPRQFNPQQLNYLLAAGQGLLEEVPLGKLYGYAHPDYKDNRNELREAVDSFRNMPDMIFCCFNSLSKATPEDCAYALQWLRTKIPL